MLRARLLMAGLLLMVTACDSSSPPTAPLGSASPSPAPAPGSPSAPATGYSISGVVTDDSGLPIPNAVVMLDHGPYLPDLNPSTVRLVTRSSFDGSYRLSLNAAQLQAGVEPFAMLRSYTLSSRIPGDHFGHVQLLERSGSNAVKDIRLRRTRTIAPGQGIAIAFDSDSSLCNYGGVSVTTLCELFVIRYPTDGLLAVEANSESGGPPPTLRYWGGTGQGTVAFQVSTEDWNIVEIALVIPVGTTPQRYNVVTRLQ